MKTILGFALLSVFNAGVAACQTEDQLMAENLYHLFSALETNSQLILAMQSPGILLPPWLDENNLSDAARISRIMNTIPQPNWLAPEPAADSVDGLYRAILAGGEVAPHKLNEAQEAQLDSAKQRLFQDGIPPTPSEDVLTYQRYKQAYESAPDGAQKRKALQDWKNLGQKNQIETARNSYQQLTSDPVEAWWTRLNSSLTTNLRSDGAGGQFLPTTPSPSYNALFDDDGWTHVIFSNEDLHSDVSSLALIGAVQSGWGPWRTASTSVHSANDSYAPGDGSSVISADVRRAPITRPWFDPSVFASRLWRFKSGVAPISISDGGLVNGGRNGAGAMPCLPTEALLVRNVQIKLSAGSVQTIRASSRARHSVSWGPFEITGSFLNDSDAGFSYAEIGRTTVRIPGVEIVGWYCNPIGKLPNPDPQIFQP